MGCFTQRCQIRDKLEKAATADGQEAELFEQVPNNSLACWRAARVCPPSIRANSVTCSSPSPKSICEIVSSSEEAIARKGFGGSPGLGANWNSRMSNPLCAKCSNSSATTDDSLNLSVASKRLCLNPKSESCWLTALASRGARLRRLADSA